MPKAWILAKFRNVDTFLCTQAVTTYTSKVLKTVGEVVHIGGERVKKETTWVMAFGRAGRYRKNEVAPTQEPKGNRKTSRPPAIVLS